MHAIVFKRDHETFIAGVKYISVAFRYSITLLNNYF